MIPTLLLKIIFHYKKLNIVMPHSRNDFSLSIKSRSGIIMWQAIME